MYFLNSERNSRSGSSASAIRWAFSISRTGSSFFGGVLNPIQVLKHASRNMHVDWFESFRPSFHSFHPKRSPGKQETPKQRGFLLHAPFTLCGNSGAPDRRNFRTCRSQSTASEKARPQCAKTIHAKRAQVLFERLKDWRVPEEFSNPENVAHRIPRRLRFKGTEPPQTECAL